MTTDAESEQHVSNDVPTLNFAGPRFGDHSERLISYKMKADESSKAHLKKKRNKNKNEILQELAATGKKFTSGKLAANHHHWLTSDKLFELTLAKENQEKEKKNHQNLNNKFKTTGTRKNFVRRGLGTNATKTYVEKTFGLCS